MMESTSRKRWHYGVPLFAALPLIAGPVYAQQDGDEQQLEEIIVTSSRIQKPDYAFSNPVISVDSEAIAFAGSTNVTDFLKELPALTGSLDGNDAAGTNAFIGGTGLSLLDLRNLGVDRTLILVDGRRHVGALPGTAAVDVDTIPIDLIERVEVQTGGASAIYGADGVSGVVNFILKKDFEGIRAKVRAGQSGDSDTDNVRFSILAGTNFAGGRGNITGSFEYNKEDRLRGVDRDFAAGGGRQIFVNNPAELNGDDPNVPDEIPLRDIRFNDSSLAGAVYTGLDDAINGIISFNGDDTAWDPGTIPFIIPFNSQGGDGTPLDVYVGDLLPEEERYTANLFASYEFSSALNLFGEVKFSRTEAFTESSPTFDFFLQLENDYAFTPPNILAATTGNDFGGAYFVSRDHVDLGVRSEDITRDTFRTVVGIEGDISSNLRYEASYVYGESEVDNNIGNNRYNDRFAAALDAVIDPATNQPVCRSNLDPSAQPANLPVGDYDPLPGTWAGSFTPGPNSGCVPLNILGNGAVSPEAAAWIMTDSLSQAKVTQHVFQAYVSGDSDNWLELPAGSIGYAAGFEWREEESRSNPPIEDQLGLTFGNDLVPEGGDYDVSEVFAEIDVPLLLGAPGAEVLSLDAAIRYSDYSTIGEATTWKIGSVWSPIDDITFRATIAEATRAPNISELFDPGGQTFQFITDPCDIAELDEGTEFRAANCAQLLNSFGVDPTTFVDPNSSNVAGTVRGNENLTEEVADTLTIGVILRPRFIENFTIAVDWYEIELIDAINTALPQVAADLCVDLPTLDNQFCGLIERDQTAGGITSFTQQSVNVAEFRTEGFDITLNYLLDPANFGASADIGTFNFRIIGNKLEDLTFVNLPGADPDQDLGEANPSNGVQVPEYQAAFNVLWNRGPISVNYALNWFDKTLRYSRETIEASPDIADPQFLEFEEQLVQNIQFRFDPNETWSFYGGVNNIADREPDIGATFYPVSAVGRFFYVGVDYAAGF